MKFILIIFMFTHSYDGGTTSVQLNTRYSSELECKAAAANAIKSMPTVRDIHKNYRQSVVNATFLCVQEGTGN